MIKLLLLPAFALVFVACSKSEDQQSSSLNEKIESFSKTACTGGTVTRYDFDGSKVYAFDNGCHYPDNGVGITDQWGNWICSLGTIAGNVDCKGKRFSTNANNPLVVFRK